MPKFNRIATVEFAVWGTNTNITLSNVPYIWNSDLDPHNIEGQGVVNAVQRLRGLGVQNGLDCVSVMTSPNPLDRSSDKRL